MPLLALIVIALLGYLIFFRVGGRTFAEYKSHHPNAFQDGKVKCYNCDSDDILLRPLGSSLFSIRNSHICRQCGTELYRSKS
jgi:hypothetical protein